MQLEMEERDMQKTAALLLKDKEIDKVHLYLKEQNIVKFLSFF